MNNTSGFLCEQPDLHPVSPNFALCAIYLRKARKSVPVKTVRTVLDVCCGFLAVDGSGCS